MFDKPESTMVSVGVATKPYPSWRLPGKPIYNICLQKIEDLTLLQSNPTGWNRYSIGYFSNNGCKYFSSPFSGKSYGIPFNHGDIVGVGYRHRTGTIFFTRNGRRLEDAYTGLRWNLFPSIGANGPCQIHVNLGQSGFVFVEANVKKWGLAPPQGTLAPPPPYGIERDTILLATAAQLADTQQHQRESSSSSRNSDAYSLHSQRRQAQTSILIDIDEDEGEENSMSTTITIPDPPPYQQLISL